MVISEVFYSNIRVYSALKGLNNPEITVDKKDSASVINLIKSGNNRFDPICEGKIPKHYSIEQIINLNENLIPKRSRFDKLYFNLND